MAVQFRITYGRLSLLHVKDSEGEHVGCQSYHLEWCNTDQDRAETRGLYEAEAPSQLFPLVLLVDGTRLVEFKSLIPDVTFEEVTDLKDPILTGC